MWEEGIKFHYPRLRRRIDELPPPTEFYNEDVSADTIRKWLGMSNDEELSTSEVNWLKECQGEFRRFVEKAISGIRPSDEDLETISDRTLHSDHEFKLVLMPNDYAFDIGLQCRDDLDNSIIPDALQQASEKNGFPLSPNAIVSAEDKGSRWTVADGNKECVVARFPKEKELAVYCIDYDSWRIVAIPDKAEHDHLSRWLQYCYQWLIAVWNKQIEVRRCALEGCNRIFILGGPGSEQRYCSASHRVRAYQIRKGKTESLK